MPRSCPNSISALIHHARTDGYLANSLNLGWILGVTLEQSDNGGLGQLSGHPEVR